MSLVNVLFSGYMCISNNINYHSKNHLCCPCAAVPRFSAGMSLQRSYWVHGIMFSIMDGMHIIFVCSFPHNFCSIDVSQKWCALFLRKKKSLLTGLLTTGGMSLFVTWKLNPLYRKSWMYMIKISWRNLRKVIVKQQRYFFVVIFC